MRKLIAIAFFISSGLLAPSYSQNNTSNSILKSNQGDSFSYDPTGRRDPFRPYGIDFEKASIPGGVINEVLTELQLIELTDFKIVAISWGSTKPSAVLRSPDGKNHFVRMYTKIGKKNGFVAKIREGEIVVVEPSEIDGVQTAVTQVLSLKK